MPADLHTRRKFLLNSIRLLVTVTSLAALSSVCDPESSEKRQKLSHLQTAGERAVRPGNQRPGTV